MVGGFDVDVYGVFVFGFAYGFDVDSVFVLCSISLSILFWMNLTGLIIRIGSLVIMQESCMMHLVIHATSFTTFRSLVL